MSEYHNAYSTDRYGHVPIDMNLIADRRPDPARFCDGALTLYTRGADLPEMAKSGDDLSWWRPFLTYRLSAETLIADESAAPVAVKAEPDGLVIDHSDDDVVPDTPIKAASFEFRFYPQRRVYDA